MESLEKDWHQQILVQKKEKKVIWRKPWGALPFRGLGWETRQTDQGAKSSKITKKTWYNTKHGNSVLGTLKQCLLNKLTLTEKSNSNVVYKISGTGTSMSNLVL